MPLFTAEALYIPAQISGGLKVPLMLQGLSLKAFYEFNEYEQIGTPVVSVIQRSLRSLGISGQDHTLKIKHPIPVKPGLGVFSVPPLGLEPNLASFINKIF